MISPFYNRTIESAQCPHKTNEQEESHLVQIVDSLAVIAAPFADRAFVRLRRATPAIEATQSLGEERGHLMSRYSVTLRPETDNKTNIGLPKGFAEAVLIVFYRRRS